MIREVKEETGIDDLIVIDGFKESISYYFTFDKKTINKEVVFFLAETKQEKVTISNEHIGFVWLPYDEAMIKLTFNNAKSVLKKADKFLRR